MSTKVATNLVGRRVKITVGTSEAQLEAELARTKPEDRRGAWAYAGQCGEVVAVFIKDGNLACQVALSDGQLVIVYADHLKLWEVK